MALVILAEALGPIWVVAAQSLVKRFYEEFGFQ
jgi:hypothetical protein